MSNETKSITSQAATTYAKANIIPVLDSLAKLDVSVTTQNKLLAYHVFETSILSGDEKINHAMIEKSINRMFDKRVTNKGLKVASYVKNSKPAQDGVIYTASQFRGSNPELHVMTVYGHIAAYESDLNKTKKDTVSVVEQSLAAAGLPVELAGKQIQLAQEGNDAAMSFVKSAMEKFTPIQQQTKEDKPLSISPAEALHLAMDALLTMAENGGDDLAFAREWLAEASELIGVESESESESESETPISQAA